MTLGDFEAEQKQLVEIPLPDKKPDPQTQRVELDPGAGHTI